MTGRSGRLVIVGAGEQAAVAFRHFCHDSPYEVVAFSAEAGQLGAGVYHGLPLVCLEDLTRIYPPGRYRAFVAVSGSPLSWDRWRLYATVKSAGYTCASYISSHAFALPNVRIGENTFVHARAALQHMVHIGNNVTVGSGTCIGHSSAVADNCFFGERAAISGFCKIGWGCFLDDNSCVDAGVSVADECILRSGAVVLKDTNPQLTYAGNPARPDAAASVVRTTCSGNS